MDGAGGDERIEHMSRPSPTHVEAEAPLRGMGVDRKHVPRHAVGSWCQRAYAKAHDVAADALAMIDPRSGCVVHFSSAELWF